LDLDQRKAVPDGPDPHKRQDGSDGSNPYGSDPYKRQDGSDPYGSDPYKRQDGSDGSNPYGSDQYRRQARDGFRDEDGPGPAK